MSSGSLCVVACVRTAFLSILLGKYPEGGLQDLTVVRVVFLSFFFFLLKDNCVTESCCFLSNLNMDQP